MDDTALRIRTARLSDAPVLLKIYAPYVEKTAITFECTVPDIEEFAARMRATLRRYPYLVAERGGARISGTGGRASGCTPRSRRCCARRTFRISMPASAARTGRTTRT